MGRLQPKRCLEYALAHSRLSERSSFFVKSLNLLVTMEKSPQAPKMYVLGNPWLSRRECGVIILYIAEEINTLQPLVKRLNVEILCIFPMYIQHTTVYSFT